MNKSINKFVRPLAFAAATAAALSTVAIPLAPHNALASDDGDNLAVQLETICANLDTAGAAALGYTVVVLNNMPNVYVGNAANEAIFALGGDDIVDGGGGRDLLCLGDDDDRGRGGVGPDAVFGEAGDDRIRGNPGDDYLVGGGDIDGCRGDNGVDSTDGSCETWIP